METELLIYDEVKVWNLIKKFPHELGFILQEKDYAAYVDTFGASDEIPITEEQFNLVKNFFKSLGENNESSN